MPPLTSSPPSPGQLKFQPPSHDRSFLALPGTFEYLLTGQTGRLRLPDEMLGGAVSSDHGGPVRLYVAPMYGYKSIKWLDGIEVVDREIAGYWEERGYDVDAWVGGSNGRNDEPPEVEPDR